MKPTLLFLLFIFTFGACSVDDENFVTINGRVERDLTGEGISNQRVSIDIFEYRSEGNYNYRVELGATEVITDDNGNFSFQAKDGERVLFSTSKEQDENYGTSELRSFRLTDSVILKVDKLLKYKVYVNNTTPVDENDFVKVDLNCFFCNTLVTKIENYGELLDIWRELALHECLAYLLFQMEEVGYNFSVGATTISTIDKLLETFSVGQIHTLIFRAVANSTRAYQSGNYSKSHAMNIVISSCRNLGERAIAEKWDLKAYNRIKQLLKVNYRGYYLQ